MTAKPNSTNDNQWIVLCFDWAFACFEFIYLGSTNFNEKQNDSNNFGWKQQKKILAENWFST